MVSEPAAPEALYLDDDLLVVDKPAGLLAVPGRGPDKADCLSARVQAAWPGALVVHRLDMATSGLVVFARHAEAQRRLGHAFATRAVDKRYVAVVDGAPAAAPLDAEDWSLIDLPLAADWPNRPLQKVDTQDGKPSSTHWRLLALEDAGRAARLELAPLTGRTHQLRVHLQAIGHPILGDMLYAGAAAQLRAPRLLLHAAALAFAQPMSGAPLRFSSPVPF
ncbi:RluA family pseudouridine synthase [Xylophilus sp. GW821-FHT01B05]